MIQIRKAEKKQVRLRIGLAGTSGSGKTASALRLASGLTDWEKICVIDTENPSSDTYAGGIPTHENNIKKSVPVGPYSIIELKPPFTPESYIEALKAAEDAGMEVIIIDSITHEWEGVGGILTIHEAMGGNSYTAWAKVTPRHNAFIQAILQSRAHVITTVRRKQDYSMDKDSQGKTVITKLGLKEVTREGFEYELTIAFAVEQNHLASASKDRTGLFMDVPAFRITEETGKTLKKWSQEGKISSPEPVEEDITDSIDKPLTTPLDVENYDVNKKDDFIAGLEADEAKQTETPKEPLITEFQMKKIFALYKLNGKTSEENKEAIKKYEGVKSMKDITQARAAHLITALMRKAKEKEGQETLSDEEQTKLDVASKTW